MVWLNFFFFNFEVFKIFYGPAHGITWSGLTFFFLILNFKKNFMALLVAYGTES